jgi:molecular chaperone IbpA
MTSKNNLSIFNQLKPVTVGFDPLFDRFERMFEDDFFNAPTINTNYPPYNIVRTGDYTYDIELALAGFGKDDINVTYEDGTVTVKSVQETKESDGKDGTIYRGISKRQFTKSFTIADDVEVKGAELKDGLLKVSLERIIPEAKKARTIEVK